MIYFDDCLILNNESAQLDDYDFAVQSLNEQIELAAMLITEGVIDTLREWWQRFVNAIKRFWNWLFGKTEETVKDVEVVAEKVKTDVAEIARLAAKPPVAPPQAPPAVKTKVAEAQQEIAKVVAEVKKITAPMKIVADPNQLATSHKKGLDWLQRKITTKTDYSDQGGNALDGAKQVADRDFEVTLTNFNEAVAVTKKCREAIAVCRKDFDTFEKFVASEVMQVNGKAFQTGRGWISQGGNLNGYAMKRLGQSLASIHKAVKGVSGRVHTSLAQMVAAKRKAAEIEADRERLIGGSSTNEHGSLLNAYM